MVSTKQKEARKKRKKKGGGADKMKAEHNSWNITQKVIKKKKRSGRAWKNEMNKQLTFIEQCITQSQDLFLPLHCWFL